MRVIKQGDTSKKLVFLLVSSTDHITPVTGATPSVSISKNGGAFATPSGTVSEIGYGWYALSPASQDVDTLGPLLLHAEAEGADPVDLEYQVVSYDPYDGDALGLGRLDTAISTRVAATDTRLDRLDVAVSTRLAATDTRLDYLDAAISSRATPASVWQYSDRSLTQPVTLSMAQSLPSEPGSNTVGQALVHSATRLDATVSSRLASNDSRLSYLDAAVSSRATAQSVWQYTTRSLTEPVTLTMSQSLPTEPASGTVGYALAMAARQLDAAISTRLAAADYVPPDNATISQIASQTDRMQFDDQNRVLAAATAEVDPTTVASAVWDAARSEHASSGTFGAVAEWAGGAAVVVQPVAARLFTPVGDGGLVTLWRYARLRASWWVDADLTGHDLRLIIYRSSQPDVTVTECGGSEVTITVQDGRSLVQVDAADSKVPSPGDYRYVVRDQTADAVLLAGRCVVMDAPDAS